MFQRQFNLHFHVELYFTVMLLYLYHGFRFILDHGIRLKKLKFILKFNIYFSAIPARTMLGVNALLGCFIKIYLTILISAMTFQFGNIIRHFNCN